MASAPADLGRFVRVVQTVGHHVKETGRVAFDTPQVLGIDFAHLAFALDQLLIFVPVPAAQEVLVQPCAFVPDEHEVLGEIPPQPLVGAVGAVHAHAVVHVLIGDGVEAEFAEELPELLFAPFLLNAPDGLGEGVGATPGTQPDGPVVVLVGQADKQFAARGVIVRADHADACAGTTHHGAPADIVGAGPVSQFLPGILLLDSKESLLPGTLHQILYVNLVGIDDPFQINGPFLRIGVAVPADGGDDALDFEPVGIGEEPDGRFVVVGFDVGRADVGHDDDPGLQALRRSGSARYANCSREEQSAG